MNTLNVKKISGLATTLVAALALSHGAAQAESTYGYNAAGAGQVSANAKVNISVSVPKLILLRVGSNAGIVDTVALTAALNPGIPGGIAAASVLDGDFLASGWDKTAPIFGAPAGTPVLAASWTNSSGGGQVTCAVTTAFPAISGLLSSHIEVASSDPLAGGALAHPGASTACGGTTPFARNTVVGSTWTYTVTPAGLTAAMPGTNTETVTYTAASL